MCVKINCRVKNETWPVRNYKQANSSVKVILRNESNQKILKGIILLVSNKAIAVRMFCFAVGDTYYLAKIIDLCAIVQFNFIAEIHTVVKRKCTNIQKLIFKKKSRPT